MQIAVKTQNVTMNLETSIVAVMKATPVMDSTVMMPDVREGLISVIPMPFAKVCNQVSAIGARVKMALMEMVEDAMTSMNAGKALSVARKTLPALTLKVARRCSLGLLLEFR